MAASTVRRGGGKEKTMGMDVWGANPTAPEGVYFRKNLVNWCPIAAFCLDVAPDVCAPCESWFTNDGEGLNAAHSVELANRLETALMDGTVEECIILLPQVGYRGYPLRERILEFVSFLRTCGGFSIC
jgi:hypothetical protein